LEDFLYEDEDRGYPGQKPYFAKHLEEFDFEEIIKEEKPRLVEISYQ